MTRKDCSQPQLQFSVLHPISSMSVTSLTLWQHILTRTLWWIFSCIRTKRYNNDSRTTLVFERASRNITVNWLIKNPNRVSNCELDCNTFVGMLQKELCSGSLCVPACDMSYITSQVHHLYSYSWQQQLGQCWRTVWRHCCCNRHSA